MGVFVKLLEDGLPAAIKKRQKDMRHMVEIGAGEKREAELEVKAMLVTKLRRSSHHLSAPFEDLVNLLERGRASW